MDDIIDQLMNIEKKANSIIEDAEQKRKNLSESIESKVQENKKAIDIHTQATILQLRNEAENHKNLKIEKAEKEHTKNVDSINKQFRENKEKWQQDIYKKIING